MDKPMGDYIIIGTAGHIDHGKTTLVKALTGKGLDTLSEEIRRGITINLGFTWLDLPNGARAGIVDVPGHERFIKNMIAGAAGIDAVVLVVAATEGVMPQTLEHLDILDSLGLSLGVVALTKTGLTDAETAELAAYEVKESLRGTFLQDADIIPVDSVTGQGLDTLTAKLETFAKSAKSQTRANAPARLNIDRVFTKKGFGAVVTGTLAEGVIVKNDELTLYPQGLTVKARNIQIHESSAEQVNAGQRAAINLSGVRALDMSRGDVLAQPGSMQGTDLLDVSVSLFNRAKRGLRFWDRARLYIGAREIMCRVIPLSGRDLEPGNRDYCQLRLEETLFCKKNDRFILRYYSPMETIGGGIVVDPRPAKHAKMDLALKEALAVKEKGEGAEVVMEHVRDNPGIAASAVAAYASVNEETAAEFLSGLVNEGKALEINGGYYSRDYIDHVQSLVLAVLEEYHRKNPLRLGIAKEAFKTQIKTGLKAKAVDSLLSLMEDWGLITVVGGVAALKAFEVTLTNAQLKIRGELLEALKSGGFAPPALTDLTFNRRDRLEVLELLSPQNVIFLDKNTVMHIDYYIKAKNSLLEYMRQNSQITLAAFRDLLGTSRKYAQLLLERFDDERITVRNGDARTLVKNRQ